MKKLAWLLAAVILLTAVLLGCSVVEDASYQDMVITDAELSEDTDDSTGEEADEGLIGESYEAPGEGADENLSGESFETPGEGADEDPGRETYEIVGEDGETGTDDRTIVNESQDAGGLTVKKNGTYTSKEEVALYIHTYGRLPSNYISKKAAEKLGWVASKGNLWEVAPGKSIGGSYFGNYEGILPDNDYRECDIDYAGGRRNAKRLVYSTDGHVYYTEDHYNSFEQLY